MFFCCKIFQYAWGPLKFVCILYSRSVARLNILIITNDLSYFIIFHYYSSLWYSCNEQWKLTSINQQSEKGSNESANTKVSLWYFTLTMEPTTNITDDLQLHRIRIRTQLHRNTSSKNKKNKQLSLQTIRCV